MYILIISNGKEAQQYIGMHGQDIYNRLSDETDRETLAQMHTDIQTAPLIEGSCKEVEVTKGEKHYILSKY